MVSQPQLPYRGSRAVLLTRHGKGPPIAAPLEQHLGVVVTVTDAFDTDRLGTFSGEVSRTMAAADCAAHKARLACELSGARWGLGSEGSFGAGPLGALVTWNVELVAWYDSATGVTVLGRAAQASACREASVGSVAEAAEFLAAVPAGQGVIVEHRAGITKGLRHRGDVERVLARHFVTSAAPVRLCYDLRAHHAPERRAVIGTAAADLADRLQRFCPACRQPDFSPDRRQPGLPCRDCDAPTGETLCRVARCARCGFEQRYPALAETADPYYCAACNP